MLHSEAGYIDARPHLPDRRKTSCNARPDHTSGSRAEELKVSTMSPLYPEKQTLARAAGMSH
jgi:hypothetical protein